MQRRQLTVLFADVVGSTAMAQGLDAEATLDVLSGALRRMASIIEAHHGRVGGARRGPAPAGAARPACARGGAARDRKGACRPPADGRRGGRPERRARQRRQRHRRQLGCQPRGPDELADLRRLLGAKPHRRDVRARRLESKARSDLDATLRSVTQATRTAFNALRSGLAQVRALEAAESSTQLALEATQLGYRVGVRVNLDVLNAQTQLFTTRRDLARARYDVLVNTLRLRQAAGELKPQDVAAVNGLLVK